MDMLKLKPHNSNIQSSKKPEFQIKRSEKAICIACQVLLSQVNTSKEFSVEKLDNWGLWDFDVFEVFIKKGTNTTEYLELQVSALSQKFALLVQKPREITQQVENLTSDLFGDYINGIFRAEFNIDLNDVPGVGDELFGNIHCILGEKSHREYFSYNPNPEARADFHKPELFINLGELCNKQV